MPEQIEGHACSLFADRDRAILPLLTFRGKVRWFELRIHRMLIRPLDVIKPTRRGRTEADISYLLVFGSVLFNGVEALGTFYAGQDGSKRTFSKFVTDFMDPAYQPHILELRDDFRNGLSHGLAIKNGGFEFLTGKRLRRDPTRGVQVHRDMLLSDFKRGLRVYLQRLRGYGPASQMGKDFLKRFEQVFNVRRASRSCRWKVVSDLWLGPARQTVDDDDGLQAPERPGDVREGRGRRAP